jgi:hypothetical protein
MGKSRHPQKMVVYKSGEKTASYTITGARAAKTGRLRQRASRAGSICQNSTSGSSREVQIFSDNGTRYPFLAFTSTNEVDIRLVPIQHNNILRTGINTVPT